MSRKLFISEPAERHLGPILIHDEDANDIAEFFHCEHATVDQTYEEALFFAKLVTKNVNVTTWFMALEASKDALDAHRNDPDPEAALPSR